LALVQLPEPIEKGIRPEVWQMVLDAIKPENEAPPEEVLSLLEQRKQVRADKNFAESDRLRDADLRPRLDGQRYKRKAQTTDQNRD
jgi:cysteinyl-tRNA synthetase